MAKKKNLKVELSPEPVSEVAAPRIDFQVWFALREKRIPQHHMREILLADFKAQGLSAKETLESYDKALAVYGVKL